MYRREFCMYPYLTSMNTVVFMPCYVLYPYYRQYPDVNPQVFSESSKLVGTLFEDAQKMTDKVSTSPEFAKRILSLAQQSKKKEVVDLLLTLGIKNTLESEFNPDGIRIILKSDCCQLIVVLRW
ncbi:hypothetical protein ACFFIX_05955 [Metabacillus herbersteinensis]|uniref:Uncharacterized protein n=1 Tax=Metabacillus herbersteinensis TaxID=283816 RepID=A0ABV6GBE7_9BACI